MSVIIPTLNEAGCIAPTIEALRAQQPLEILVVDGGSSDDTVVRASAADVVLLSPPGRGRQMNAGAAQARGDFLLFLHADCTLGDGALAAATRCLDRTGAVAGCFSMCVRADGPLYRSIDAAASARVRLTGLVYGDQGLFLRRETFFRLGGFPGVHFMEDVLFSKRLRRHGRVVVLRDRIFVSPRRWQRVGLVRQTVRNWTLLALAAAGVHPDRLAQHYPAVR